MTAPTSPWRLVLPMLGFAGFLTASRLLVAVLDRLSLVGGACVVLGVVFVAGGIAFVAVSVVQEKRTNDRLSAEWNARLAAHQDKKRCTASAASTAGGAR